MKKHDHTAFNSEQNKGKKSQAQLKALSAYLRRNTVSRWMAAIALNIPLQSVCFAIGELRDSDSVAVAKKGRCAISGRFVEFLTTDPDKFPQSNQLILPLQ